MSSPARRRPHPVSPVTADGLFAKIEQELSEGYLEVEITGMTMRRLLCVYSILFRGAWNYTLGSVRSLVRVTPAH